MYARRCTGFQGITQSVLAVLLVVGGFLGCNRGQSGETKGMLDLVFCIDRSGSMIDDIQAVQNASGAILDGLSAFAEKDGIEMQVGLVTYSRHTDADWLWARAMSPNITEVRENIMAITIPDASLGGGGNEDLYGALVYAMGRPVSGERFVMGWRKGAAKVIIAIGDEPPDEPDWEGRTQANIVQIARALHTVHIYPVVLPKSGPDFLDPAVRAAKRLAHATRGQVVHVSSAAKLPDALVSTVKTAVRRHRNEVWRQEHPPYLLYGVLAGMLAVAVFVFVGMIARAGRPSVGSSRHRV